MLYWHLFTGSISQFLYSMYIMHWLGNKLHCVDIVHSHTCYTSKSLPLCWTSAASLCVHLVWLSREKCAQLLHQHHFKDFFSRGSIRAEEHYNILTVGWMYSDTPVTVRWVRRFPLQAWDICSPPNTNSIHRRIGNFKHVSNDLTQGNVVQQ